MSLISKIDPEPLAIFTDAEIRVNKKDRGEFFTITLGVTNLVKRNVLQQGEKVIVAVWQEGRV